jgi:alpha-glucosidase
LLQELRSVIDEYEDRMLVGEIDDLAYYGDGTNELHMVFNFPLMRTHRITPAWIRKNQHERLAALPPAGWPCNTLNNHDAPRVYSRYGDGQYNDQIARLNLALMLTLKGTPFLYSGEEIGMSDLMLGDIEQFRDNLSVWIYRAATQQMGVPAEDALKMVQNITRDKCRTPNQWDSTPNAGFCPQSVKPWLPVNPNYATGINVADQQSAANSILNFYKQLLTVRKQTPALIAGEYQALHLEAEAYFAFLRQTPQQRCLVVLNYSEQPHQVSFDLASATGKLLFSSVTRAASFDFSQLELAPFEILIAAF